MGQFLPDWLLAPRELKVLDRFMDGVVDKALAQTKEKPDTEADSNLNLVLEMAQKGRGRKVLVLHFTLTTCFHGKADISCSTSENKSLVLCFLPQRHVSEHESEVYLR
jgi:hypothetical protein